MTVWSLVTEVLARDVAVGGGVSSPLLSWLGAAGLLLFFGWQVARLLVDVNRASAPFVAVEPLLTSLAGKTEESDLRGTYERAFAEDRNVGTIGKRSRWSAVDIDQLTALDTAMRETGAFRRPWIQFRKTLLIERVPWFKEPRIFSTRRADEFFTADSVLSPSLDVAFYGQLPSLFTGLGLLLTFVAICIGLSRLHADGPTITGVQGLINGLAGKFLTSIVALVCANVFILVERPALRRLRRLHGEFVTLLDESLPRRTVEDLLDALDRHRGDRPLAVSSGASDDTRRLGASIDALTSAVRVLAERTQQPWEAVQVLATTIQTLHAGKESASLVDRLAFAGSLAPEEPTVVEGSRNVVAIANRERRLG